MKRIAPLLAGYAGLAGFFALEAFVRPAGPASSLRASSDDRGTTQEIVRAFTAGVIVPPLLARLPFGRVKRPRSLGLAVEASGLVIRAWSMRTLGDAYTRTLRTGGQQRVVQDGPYRLVRHPGYLGSLLTWIGFGFASGSLPATALLAWLFGGTYRRRIEAEEALLIRDLPGYARYRRRTWRLLPLVW